MEALAKEEYTTLLTEFLWPQLYRGFKRIWIAAKNDAKINHKPYDLMKYFQTRLESIAGWNQFVIDAEYNDICSQPDQVESDKTCHEYLKYLLDAVFVASTKVLSSIRLKEELDTIPLSVPDPKIFIHRCYLNAARKFWREWDLFDDRDYRVSRHQQQRNMHRCIEIIGASIHATIRELLPIRDILKQTLKQGLPNTNEATPPQNLDDDRGDEEEHEEEEGGDLEEDQDEEGEDHDGEIEQRSGPGGMVGMSAKGLEDEDFALDDHKSDDHNENDENEEEKQERERESVFTTEPKGHLDVMPGDKIEDMKQQQQDQQHHRSPSPSGPKYAGVDDPFFDDDDF